MDIPLSKNNHLNYFNRDFEMHTKVERIVK